MKNIEEQVADSLPEPAQSYCDYYFQHFHLITVVCVIVALIIYLARNRSLTHDQIVPLCSRAIEATLFNYGVAFFLIAIDYNLWNKFHGEKLVGLIAAGVVLFYIGIRAIFGK